MLVSVVIPAFNATETIERTIRSACDQDYDSIEIIIVDDGSSDETSEVALAVVSSRPTRIVRQPNQGVASARNAGLAQARGELVALLDADDLWHPTKIRRQVETYLAAGRQVGLVYCLSRAILSDDSILFSPATPAVEGDVYGSLLASNFVANASAPLIDTALLRAVGGFNEELHRHGCQGCEDLDVYLKIARSHDFACVDAFLVGYRIGPATMSSNLERMLRSWDLVIAAEQEVNPGLPTALVRYGRANLLRWLSMMARRNGQTGKMLQFLGQALVEDPQSTLAYLGSRVLQGSARLVGTPLAIPDAHRRFKGLPFSEASPERSLRAAEWSERRGIYLAASCRRPCDLSSPTPPRVTASV